MINNKISLEELLKDHKISQRTYDKAKIAKHIIERKYNLQDIKNVEWSYIIEKINSLDLSEEEKDKIKKEIIFLESSKFRFLRKKQTIRDYESLSIIGRGAFGEVHVCRNKITGEIVAVKKIKKEVLFVKNQVIHVRNEQLFMSKVKSPWIVDLKASFQDEDYLYLIMEYLPGGDLMNLLIKKDILTEEEARFYLAELILSIESIHKLDCIHRDIKPDNILIDKTGHIKLSDFGLAKVSEKLFEQKNCSFIDNNDLKENKDEIFKHKKNYSCVGTAYYVAPEVLTKMGYGPEIDWWSVGVIFFEMLIGYAPFCSKDTSEACHKILNWKKYLKIPSKVKISREAEDLIANLINNPNKRLGVNGADEIKAHPFFKGLNWDNILKLNPPFIPKLKNDYDCHYFDTYKEIEPFYPKIKKAKKRKDIEYMGYTYKDDPKNDWNLFNEFQIAIQKLNKNVEKNNSNRALNDTSQGCTECQTKKSSRLNENSKIYLNNKRNNKAEYYLELNLKTEPNNNRGIIDGLRNYLDKNKNSSIQKVKSKDKNNISNVMKNYKTSLNSKKHINENDIKLNIIQLPTKKISKNNTKNQVNNDNKLITLNNFIKKRNIINLNNSKNKNMKKYNYDKKILNKSNPEYKRKKLSPSPNQNNNILQKLIDKCKSKQKEIRGISGDNARNICYKKNNLIKKCISENTIKKILGRKNTSIEKGKNNLIKKMEERKYSNNKKKNIMKNINIINIKKKNGPFNLNERNSSPSTKVAY